MDTVYNIIVTVFCLLVFLQVFSLILMTTRLLKLQFWTPSFITVARAEAAEELPYLDAARAVLEHEGFQYVATRRVRAITAAPSMLGGHTDVYYHPGRDVHAEACAAAVPTPRSPFDIFLWNTYTDGTALLTVNGLAHLIFTFPDSVTIADGYAPTFPLQLAHHMEARAQRYVQRTDPADAAALSAATASAMLPGLVREGKAYVLGTRDGESIYGMRLFAAIQAALRVRGGLGRRKAMEAKQREPGVLPEAAPDVRHASEQHSFVRNLLSLRGLQAPRWFRWSAFVVSAAAFLALGTWWWGWSGALVIGAVVAVHEAGHWLAMRLAGFRDVQVFFVPGMGAATSGEKHDARPLTHLAVYLAGPMPGLLLAMCGIGWMMSGQADVAAAWYPGFVMAVGAAFLINLLNLVPVMPLDGGRVVDLFVMGRLPWFRFAFGLASGAVLIWLGYASGDKVIGGLGLLSVLALPHHYRMAKVARDLLRQSVKAPFAAEDFALSAARLFDFLAQPAYKDWTFQAKMGVGQNILPRFLGRLPNLKETMLGLSIYLACLLAPLALLIAFAVREPQQFRALSPLARAAPAKVAAKDAAVTLQALNAARLAAASSPAQRLEVLGELIDEAHEYDETEEEQRLAKMLYAATASFAQPSRERADAALKLAIALRDTDDRQSVAQVASLLDEAETALRARQARQDDGSDALLLARVLGARMDGLAAPARLAMRQEIVDLHAAHWRASKGQLLGQRTSFARALDAAGRKAEAEYQLTMAREDGRRLPAAFAYARNALALNHGWFLMSSQRPRDAVDRVAEHLDKPVSQAPGWYSFDRDAYMLAAIAARSRGDWQEVKARTSPLQTLDDRPYGNWLFKLFRPKLRDLRAGLLLVEAERKLGHGAVADELVADMRGQYMGKKSGTPACSLGTDYDDWRQDLASAVGENEKREFKCEDPPPPLSCPAPAQNAAAAANSEASTPAGATAPDAKQ